MIMDILEFYKNRERYGIQTTKSSNLPLHLSTESKKNSTDTCVTLDGEQISSVFETVHLGIDRNTRSLVISRTLYSLMGAGADGNSGLSPPVSFHMWKPFALPRMLYGIEVSNLRRSETVQLESLQRSILRRLQCLPNNTANVAVYCLLGARPVEQEIYYKKLSLLASNLYSENTIEFELAGRHMAIKGNDSNSWFIHCNHLLHKYKLPNIYNLKQSTNSKETLKTEILFVCVEA